MTSQEAMNDLAYLTAEIRTPPERMEMLRSTLELSLLKLGHSAENAAAAVADFFKRTVH